MENIIYVIGHKSPDLDSVAGAISYANLKNKLENTEKYVPACAGEINLVTKFVLEKFGFPVPEILNAETAEVILVDHNDASQRFSESESVKIVEILDHHKFDFKSAEPITITVLPWGSSNSIIYKKYTENNIAIDKNLSGLMLSAILDDTVITKSPTCTEIDKKFITELSELSGIADWQSYGIEMFKKKSNVADKSADEIIKIDFKDFNFKAGKFGIGQVETVDLNEFNGREDELMTAVAGLKQKEDYAGVVLFITDIIQEGSKFFVAVDDSVKTEEALGAKLENGQVYIPGILSRKKQVLPKFTELFDN